VDFAATGRVIPMDEDDAWLLDQSELTLARGSGKTRLTRKTADVLACLIRNSGRVVAQDVLLREVWPGITVKVDLVREYVCDLRALLGDDAETPRLIETVRGLGYRLVGNVRLSDRRSWIEPRLVTVAVVGLAGPAQDRRGQCMALGLAEDIRSELSRSPEIAVFADEPSPADRWQQAESRPDPEPDRADRLEQALPGPERTGDRGRRAGRLRRGELAGRHTRRDQPTRGEPPALQARSRVEPV
jgi:DNA-binding winged helix-turn-helix (wHTH) protein